MISVHSILTARAQRDDLDPRSHPRKDAFKKEGNDHYEYF